MINLSFNTYPVCKLPQSPYRTGKSQAQDTFVLNNRVSFGKHNNKKTDPIAEHTLTINNNIDSNLFTTLDDLCGKNFGQKPFEKTSIDGVRERIKSNLHKNMSAGELNKSEEFQKILTGILIKLKINDQYNWAKSQLKSRYNQNIKSESRNLLDQFEETSSYKQYHKLADKPGSTVSDENILSKADFLEVVLRNKIKDYLVTPDKILEQPTSSAQELKKSFSNLKRAFKTALMLEVIVPSENKASKMSEIYNNISLRMEDTYVKNALNEALGRKTEDDIEKIKAFSDINKKIYDWKKMSLSPEKLLEIYNLSIVR